ncbi:MAG: CBS domain-containing protein, partial [Chitinophagaceae bacterium]
SFALQLMDDFEVSHLPITSEDKWVGLIAKEDLLDADEMQTLASLAAHFIQAMAKKDAFFVIALKTIAEQELSLLPIVSDTKELLGVVTAPLLVQQLSIYLGNEEPGAWIVIEIERRNYSFGEISRLVETNDAYITQLNTYTEPSTGLVIVSIKINKVEISDILATFHRYEYVVRYYFGEENYANELKENYTHLMAYLNV